MSGSQLDVLVQSRLLLGAGAAAVLKSVFRERKEKQFLLFAVFLHVIISPCLSVLFELANSFYFQSCVGLKLKHNVLKFEKI